MTRIQLARANRLGVSPMNALSLSVEAANALRLEGYRTANAELERDAVETLNWIRAGRNTFDCRRFTAQKLCQTFLNKALASR
jgi:5-carboxymethyl-2-hydroxymuconate isomerase